MARAIALVVGVVACAPPITHSAYVRPGRSFDVSGSALATRSALAPGQGSGGLPKYSGGLSAQFNARYGLRGTAGGLYVDLAIPIGIVTSHLSLYYQLPISRVDVGAGVNLGLLPGAYVMAGGHSPDFDYAFGLRGLFFVPAADDGQGPETFRTTGIAPFAVVRRRYSHRRLSIGAFAEVMVFGRPLEDCPSDGCGPDDYYDQIYTAGMVIGF